LNSFKNIQSKLQKFIKKFYVNELIKGLLLFFSIGFLYFIFTILIEHFFWLKPLARTILFWVFITVEAILVYKFIVIPISKLSGLKKGISEVEASNIIGKHFPEVSDKLLNLLQLKNTQLNTELINASIDQKSKQLQPIPFKKAIDFSKNKKYIKYALIPIVIWLLTVVTGKINIFSDSFTRVVHYNTQYEPPAPFSFQIVNKSFNVIEGTSFNLMVKIDGNTLPEDVKINFSNQNYYLENKGFGKFEYNFNNIKKSFSFYLEANGFVSKTYQINCIQTPVITNFKMVLNYPSYTKKTNEVIQNTGNAIVPQGTTVNWQVETHQTNNVKFILNESEPINFNQNTKDYFSFSKQILNATNYKITTSNQQLTNHESLNFNLQVISDEYPKITVASDIDSISSGPVQFIGELSDDYGVNKLQLVYYNKNTPNSFKTHQISILKSVFTDFYYVFPEEISIEEGIDYEFYFEVFDNDAINGSKKSKSSTYSYYNKTKSELNEELLIEQKESISEISKALDKSKETTKKAEQFKNELQKKAEVNWNDTKKVEEFLKRQNQYQEMFQKQTKKLEQNLNNQPKSDKLNDKREALQQRIEETKEMAKQQKLLDELEKLSQKMKKEELVDKLKEITKKNQQNDQSLERILELMKRFYVEQKANQISEKLAELSKEQEELSKQSDSINTIEKQEKINDEFDKIKSDFKELDKQNKDLLRPMKLPNAEQETKDINEDLEKASESLKSSEQGNAKKSQNSAAKKMKQLSKTMEQSMSKMQGEQIDENIEDLRKIVENLIEFSFQQEALMNNFSGEDSNHPKYASNLKQQYVLKKYFEHIDDSLYMLSLRLTKMSNSIQKEVSEVHYNIDESLTNFAENNFVVGVSNQQFVITSANNLADLLSDLLESLLNASASMGEGKGGSNDFSLPDIIQKQGELTDKMKEGLKKGNQKGGKEGEQKDGNEGENGEQSNEELYEIYKQQSQLREALKEIMGEQNEEGKNGSGDALKQMEELEQQLLEKGFSNEIIEKMKLLNYELLKLEDAIKEQGEDNKRKSESNFQDFQKRTIQKLNLQNQYFNYNEILNRQSLPLRSNYKKKVQEYFKTQ